MKKRIFFKSKKKNKYIILFFLLIFSLTIVIFLYFKNKSEIFIIKENKNNFYFTPKDKEGKNIANTEKKILHFNDPNIQEGSIKNIDFKFSIQLYASYDYNTIIDKLNDFSSNSSFNENDFSVVVLRHDIGFDYLLMYKNFDNRNKALEHCAKFLKFIDNCLIINLQNLN